MAAAALVFVLLFIPETKGKSLEELEGVLLRQDPSSSQEPLAQPVHS
jgi:hypothetical protein